MAGYEDIGKRLREALRGPSLRRNVPEGFRRAGVLVPLISRGAECLIVLTTRTQEVETHKGQVSFPGGMMDSGDPDIAATALRETQEELGIAPDSIEIIGWLDDLATPTRFVITPIVGILSPSVEFTPNPLEVAEVFHLPLSFFSAPGSGRREIMERDGSPHEVWFYDDGSHLVWGATAAIIRTLLKRLAAV